MTIVKSVNSSQFGDVGYFRAKGVAVGASTELIFARRMRLMTGKKTVFLVSTNTTTITPVGYASYDWEAKEDDVIAEALAGTLTSLELLPTTPGTINGTTPGTGDRLKFESTAMFAWLVFTISGNGGEYNAFLSAS